MANLKRSILYFHVAGAPIHPTFVASASITAEDYPVALSLAITLVDLRLVRSAEVYMLHSVFLLDRMSLISLATAFRHNARRTPDTENKEQVEKTGAFVTRCLHVVPDIRQLHEIVRTPVTISSIYGQLSTSFRVNKHHLMLALGLQNGLMNKISEELP